MELRTSSMTARSPQVDSSGHEHFWYLLWLTQRIGARGPSITRTTWPSVMLSIGLARK